MKPRMLYFILFFFFYCEGMQSYKCLLCNVITGVRGPCFTHFCSSILMEIMKCSHSESIPQKDIVIVAI